MATRTRQAVNNLFLKVCQRNFLCCEGWQSPSHWLTSTGNGNWCEIEHHFSHWKLVVEEKALRQVPVFSTLLAIVILVMVILEGY